MYKSILKSVEIGFLFFKQAARFYPAGSGYLSIDLFRSLYWQQLAYFDYLRLEDALPFSYYIIQNPDSTLSLDRRER
jgi:hypothetical protein